MSSFQRSVLQRSAGQVWMCLALACAFVGAWLALELPSEARAEASATNTRPFLWRIEMQPPSYLFGTIHVPDARVLALPDSVRAALDASSIVYTEVPMDVRAQLEAQKLSMFSGATTLKTVLPEDLYQRLEAYMQSRGIPMLLFSRYKVWAVAASLPLLDQFAQAQQRVVLDQYLAEQARARNKQADALETVESQVAVMESMGDDGQLLMLDQTLEYLERLDDVGESAVEDLILAYLSGSDERLLKLAQEQFDASDALTPAVRDALIYKRNRSMTETIQKKLAERPEVSHFFAVGVLHYPGEGGIVELLRERGFEVSRVETLAD